METTDTGPLDTEKGAGLSKIFSDFFYSSTDFIG